jgi:molybdopterin synthase catalytic subunit
MAIQIQITNEVIHEPKPVQLDPSEVGAILEYWDLVKSKVGSALLTRVDEPKLKVGLEKLAGKISEEFELPQIEVIQRVGNVPIGDARLFVRMSASHSNEAFRAMLEFLDGLKRLEKTVEALEA